MKKQQLLVFSGPIANLTEKSGYTLDVLCWRTNINACLQQAGQVDGILINTGDLALESQSLCRTLRSIKVPCIEVFISHFGADEAHSRQSIVASECVGVIGGFGNYSYLLALAALANLLLP